MPSILKLKCAKVKLKSGMEKIDQTIKEEFKFDVALQEGKFLFHFWLLHKPIFCMINRQFYWSYTQILQSFYPNRPFSYSDKESQSNDTVLHFVEFSNVHNSDRSFNATRSSHAYKNV